MKARNPVSPENALLFDSYMTKWQSILNLNDWRIERSSKQAVTNMAEVVFDPESRLATYKIGRCFGSSPVTPFTLEATALHEVLHVLLYDLANSDASTVAGAEHQVINVLEKLLLQGGYSFSDKCIEKGAHD